MESVIINGIKTRYEILGSGTPLLMFSPGGFDSSLDNWRHFSIYARLNLLDHLSKNYTCITFDRRESGQSGGQIEAVTWKHYADQGKGLLEYLGIQKAHLMGGCVGCSSVLTLAHHNPELTLSMVLYSPAGGVKYRINQHSRLNQHLSFAVENGLSSVVELAKNSTKTFSQDPRVGPWVSVIRNDIAFANQYGESDIQKYQIIIGSMVNGLFKRDTVPGPDPEHLMLLDAPALIVPGQDTSHAPSAARYLQECLPINEYWDMPVADQSEETAPARVLEFLNSIK